MAGVILHSAASITGLLRSFFVAERTAELDGVLQRLRAREKLLGVAALVAATVVSREVTVLLALAAVPIALASLSSVPLRRLLVRSAIVPLVSVVVVLPQAFLMPGPALTTVLGFPLSSTGSIYVVAFAVRVWTAVALLALIVLTTPFSSVLAGLRELCVPTVFVWTLAITYRYLFLLVSELDRLSMARRSRGFRGRDLRGSWRDLGRLAGTFLLRTIERGERVHRGMVSRGGSQPPSPYPSAGTVGRAEVAFVAFGVAVFVGAGVVRWAG